MRQQAHRIRRPDWRRRLRWAVIATGGFLLAIHAAGLGTPDAFVSAGLTAAQNQAPAVRPTSSDAGAASRAPATGAFAGLAPAHPGKDAWPGPTPLAVALLTGYAWPIAHPRLTLPYGPTPWGSRVVDGAPFHDGIDLATFCGDRVTAAHDGVVLAAGRHFDNVIGWVGSLDAYFQRLDVHRLWGELPIVVIIDDGNTYRSVYAHFGRVVVKAGQHVHAGQLIGYEGMSGHATGCHLHYGLFSPDETATFGIEPKVAKEMRLPTLEIARVDPLLALPYRRGLSGPPENLGGG
jgi:murein DD-endopeptidase MepM/ murein hydrolase activator NlpD